MIKLSIECNDAVEVRQMIEVLTPKETAIRMQGLEARVNGLIRENNNLIAKNKKLEEEFLSFLDPSNRKHKRSEYSREPELAQDNTVTDDMKEE